jgi:hypothetical protein
MKHFKLFESFIFESEDWRDILFTTQDEKEVADIAEEELLTKELVVFNEGEDSFNKLEQMASTDKGEKVLENTSNELTKFSVPFEFLKWDVIGSDKLPIESSFIMKKVDTKKL